MALSANAFCDLDVATISEMTKLLMGLIVFDTLQGFISRARV